MHNSYSGIFSNGNLSNPYTGDQGSVFYPFSTTPIPAQTTTTTTTLGSTTTTLGSGNVIGHNFGTYPNRVKTEKDDNDLDVLTLVIGDEKQKCKYKIRILPEIQIYTQHQRPSKFRRFMYWLIFGIKWESTYLENFIEQL